jgi:hypothetical protein
MCRLNTTAQVISNTTNSRNHSSSSEARCMMHRP